MRVVEYIILPIFLFLLLLSLVLSGSTSSTTANRLASSTTTSSLCPVQLSFTSSSPIINNYNGSGTKGIQLIRNSKFWLRVHHNTTTTTTSSTDENDEEITTNWFTSIPITTDSPLVNSRVFIVNQYSGEHFLLRVEVLERNVLLVNCTVQFSIFPSTSTVYSKQSQEIVHSMSTVYTEDEVGGVILFHDFQAMDWVTDCEQSDTLLYSYFIDGRYLLASSYNTSHWKTLLPFGKREITLQVSDQCGTFNTSMKAVLAPGPIDIDSLVRQTEYLIANDQLIPGGAVPILLDIAERSFSNDEKYAVNQIVNLILNFVLGTTSIPPDQQLTILYLVTESQADTLSKKNDLLMNVQNMTISGAAQIGIVGDLLCNMLLNGITQTKTDAAQLMSSVDSFTHSIISQQLLGENEMLIDTQGYKLATKRMMLYSLSNSLIPARDNNTILIPDLRVSSNSRALKNVTADIPVAYSVAVFYRNPYSFSKTSSNMVSFVLDFHIRDEDGNAFELTNPAPLYQIQLEKVVVSQKYEGEFRYECKGWSSVKQAWTNTGCKVLQVDQYYVTCQCDHTGTVAAFRYSEELPAKNVPSSSIEIFMNTMYMLVCTFAICKLFIMRNKQPVKSRFIAPYVGIIAIIMDSLLEGWIKNLLLLFITDEDIIYLDILHYITWLAANPLVIAAMFVYLWQQIRFITLKNLYHIMANDPLTHRPNYIMRFSQLVASKYVFTAVTALVVGLVEVFYIVLVVLCIVVPRVKKVSSNIQALSYAVFVIVLGISILIMLIIDMIAAIERRRDLSVQDKELGTVDTSTVTVTTSAVVANNVVSPSVSSNAVSASVFGIAPVQSNPAIVSSPTTHLTVGTISSHPMIVTQLRTDQALSQSPTLLYPIQPTNTTDKSPPSPRTPVRMQTPGPQTPGPREETVTVTDMTPATPMKAPMIAPTFPEKATQPHDFTTVVINHFTKHDYFMFRFESLFLLLTIAVMLAFYGTMIYTKYYGITDSSSPIVIVQKILEKIFKFLEKLAFGGFIVLMITFKTILKVLRKWKILSWLPIEYFSKPIKKRDKSKFNALISDMLNCENGYSLAFNFYRQEFALEKILLWRDLEMMKQKGPDSLPADFERIFDIYIQMHGERELVTIGNYLRYKMHKIYRSEKPTAEEMNKAIQALYKELMKSLQENFSRLERTQDYKLFAKMKHNLETLPIEMEPFEP